MVPCLWCSVGDQGRCFDSNIIKALCKIYGVEQSFTSPYNPHGNAFCEHFNHMLFGLLKTLKAEEKVDWPSHLPALVFAYNTTAHASNGYQPYQPMFRCHDPAPCNNWLRLHEYNDNKLITRIDWVDQQLEQLLQTFKCVQKNIKASNSKNRKVVGVKICSSQLEIEFFFGITRKGTTKFRITIKTKSM